MDTDNRETREFEDLVVSVLCGDATEKEIERLERWRNESSANNCKYNEFVFAWEQVALFPRKVQIPVPPTRSQIVAAAEHRNRPTNALKTGSIARRKPPLWTAVAAAAALLVVCLYTVRSPSPSVIVETGTAETRTITLDDGSVVRLAPNSRLSLWDENSRLVALSGLAFFAVVTDSARPFVIRTNVGFAEVRGTRFEMRTGADSLRVVVVEGSVAVSADGRQVEVNRGEMTQLTNGAHLSEPRQVDIWRMLDWPTGLLMFQATPLPLAVAELQTHFDTPFVIDDSQLASRSLTIWFENEPLGEVVNALCQVIGARCIVADTVRIGS